MPLDATGYSEDNLFTDWTTWDNSVPIEDYYVIGYYFALVKQIFGITNYRLYIWDVTTSSNLRDINENKSSSPYPPEQSQR